MSFSLAEFLTKERDSMDLLKLQEELREKALQRSRDEKAAKKANAPAASKVRSLTSVIVQTPKASSVVSQKAQFSALA